MTTQYTQEERVTKRDSVIRKIKACLARAAEGSGATPEEAAIAARQAEGLMRKYNIEMAQVIMEDLNDPRSFSWAYVRTNMFKNNKAFIKKVQDWPQWIAVPCAKLYDCHASIRMVDGDGYVIAFFGYKMDVDVCCWVYDYLLDCCRRRSLEIQEWEAMTAGLTLNKYRKQFRAGMAIELARRLVKLAEDRNREMAKGGGTALVVRKLSAVEEQFGSFNYQKGDASEANSVAGMRGREAASRINLTPNPLTNKTAKQEELES